MENLNALGNIKLNKEEGYILFTINPSIYPIDLIYSASYILFDKAYVILDGDPVNEIFVEIRAKEKNQNLNELAMEFNKELLNYAVYKAQSKKNKRFREMIMQRALLTNDLNYFNTNLKKDNDQDKPLKDTEGIMESWDEKDKEKEIKKDEKC